MRPMSRIRAVLTVFALLAVAALPVLAQQAEQHGEPAQDVFGETIEVRVVNLEVVVTDRDGNRVTGLAPEDFRLTVDGDEVAIEYFSEIVGGNAVAMPAAGEGSRVQGIPLAVPGEPVGTRYLVFIDDYFSIARDRNQVLREIADDLAFLAPGDQMAIVAFDGKRVEMLTSWTDSNRELRRAFGDAQQRPAFGLQRISELRSHDSTLGDVRTARSNDSLQELSPEDRFYANQVADRLDRTSDAVVATLRGFAQPPGRRVMLMLSGGWPFSPAAYASGSRQVLETGQVPSGEELYRPIIDTANLTGYTIYPVDVPGLGSGTGADASDGAAGSPIEREANLEDALRYIAGETGGRALINAARKEPLATTAQDTRSYYWLGFSPSRVGDDARHRIRVETTRPGLRVRTRENFLDMSRQAERTMAVESALLFGDPATEGTLAVEVGTPQRSGRRFMEVPLTIAIPTDLVTALQEGDVWVVKAELRVGALDEADRQSEIPSVPVEFRFRERPDAGKLIPYETNLKLRRIEQVLVISLTDVVGGRSLTTRVEVAP